MSLFKKKPEEKVTEEKEFQNGENELKSEDLVSSIELYIKRKQRILSLKSEIERRNFSDVVIAYRDSFNYVDYGVRKESLNLLIENEVKICDEKINFYKKQLIEVLNNEIEF